MMKKGIIFDLDGTLLYSLEDLCNSTNYALNYFGYPQRTLDEVRNFVGNGVRLLIERAIPDGNQNPDFGNCLEIFKEHYKNNMYNKTAPYPGILEMLNELNNLEVKTAVVSNKFDAAVKELCNKFFPGLIGVAIGENEAAGIRKKPAPDSVFKSISDLGLDKKSVLYVGDSETDVQTAKNADLKCIGCSWGFRDKSILQNEGADYIIDYPSEIITILTS